MNDIVHKYNRSLIGIFVFAPFVAFFTFNYLNMDFNRTMQLLSFVGVILLLLFRKNTNPIKFPKYLFFYFLFVLYVFFSTFVLLDREFKMMYLFSNKFIGALNFMFIVENIHIGKKEYKYFLQYSKYILVVAFLVILYQQIVDPYFFVNTIRLENFIESSTSENRLPSIYSWLTSIAVGFGFVPVFILIVEDLDRRNKNILLWILFGLLFAFLTKARWIMLNSLLVFVIVFKNHKEQLLKVFKYAFLLPVIGLTSFFALNLIGVDAEGIVKDRILESDKKTISQTSAGTRLLAFKAFNELFWDHPIFGIGDIKSGMGGTGKQDYKLRRFLAGRSSQIHVGYLSLFYKYGIIGGFFFLIFLFLLLKKIYENAKLTQIWAPFLGILGFALANLTLVYFSLFEMGLIIILVAERYNTQNIIK